MEENFCIDLDWSITVELSKVQIKLDLLLINTTVRNYFRYGDYKFRMNA